MTERTAYEPHLSADEWATILLTLKLERESADGDYRRWLGSIIQKIDIALNGVKP